MPYAGAAEWLGDSACGFWSLTNSILRLALHGLSCVPERRFGSLGYLSTGVCESVRVVEDQMRKQVTNLVQAVLPLDG